MSSPLLIPFPRRRRRPYILPPWRRAARTFLLGCLLGLIGAALILATLAVVGAGPSAQFHPSVPEEIARHARSFLPALEPGPVWRLVSIVQAPGGRHARLRPYLLDVEIRGADVSLTIPPDDRGAVRARFERDPRSVDWEALAHRLVPTTQPEAKSRGRASLTGDALLAILAEPTWYVELARGAASEAAAALHVETTVAGPAGSLRTALRRWPGGEVLPEAEGPVDLVLTLDPATLEVVEVRDARHFAAGTALVFDPNPVATSGRLDLRNGDPVDAWRLPVTLERLDGSGLLNGRLVETATQHPPRAEEPTLHYDYLSADPRFEEVMAYYHGDRALAHAESLGFAELFRQPLQLRLHASSADNSWYSHPLREIVFGDGGVDDAEDADIILHECGHALHDALVPGFGAGDTRALSEGFSDFWAASLTGGACVGDWDATSYSPPCLRRVDATATYPGWLTGLPHHDGMLWSALLWDLRALLGARAAERLALATLLETDTGTTWEEAAGAVVRAAERIGLGPALPGIREAIARRGFGPLLVETSLQAGEAHRLDLLSAARFLDHEVTAVLLQGDGRLLFLQPGETFESQPFPAGPPTVVPCGLQGSTTTRRLEVRCEVREERARIQQRWLDGDRETARVVATWDLTEGDLVWRYEYLAEAEAGGFFAGATDGGPEAHENEVTPVLLTALPEEGVGGLRAFRAELLPPSDGAAATLLGAAFELSADPTGFRLQRRTAPLATPGGGLELTVAPNPAPGRCEIRLLLGSPSRSHVAIYDVTGREIRSFGWSERPVGLTPFLWDGRDEGGRPLPAGLYWARAEAGGHRAARRILLLD